MSAIRSPLFVAAGLLASMAFASKAEAKYIQCDFCDPWQMRDAAMYAGDGSHTVFDIGGGVIRHYQVSGWGESPIEFGVEKTVIEAPASPGELAAMQELMQYAQIYGAPMIMNVEVHVSEIRANAPQLGLSGNITAYDIQSDVNLRTALQSRIESSISIRSAFAASMDRFMTLVENVFGGNVPYSINITIRTDDGGQVTYSKAARNGQYSYVQGSARFANGQVVPAANTSEYQGVWNFSGGTSIDDFLAALNDIGAHIEGAGTPGETETWVCTWKAAESTLHCVKQL
ncbi:hypothetical protein [uncultured Stenotrophomonas sp.]|uniref:hypothetical protein n=1 Tax=uncultured Stenotrophomonas sp. TaxID=165438 RepID=UPI0025D76BD0|nr:hypothetical protein [uncultured Stenotrophomonas sp.]